MAEDGRGRRRQGDRGQGGLHGRRGDRRAGRGTGSAPEALGHRAVQLRSHDRRGNPGRLRPPDRAAAVQEGRRVRRDRGRGQAGRHGRAARQ